MAINPETQYPGKIKPASADYPYGEARNITLPGDGTGTPWEAALVNDVLGFQQALLSDAGVVPSGTPDKVGASQYLQALFKSTGLVREDYTELRAVKSPELLDKTECLITGAGVGGHFVLDLTDVATVDDNMLTIVDGDGGRWKRLFSGFVNVQWAEAIGDGVTNDAVASQAALDSGFDVLFPFTSTGYLTRSTLTCYANQTVYFEHQVKLSGHADIGAGAVLQSVAGTTAASKKFIKVDNINIDLNGAAIGLLVNTGAHTFEVKRPLIRDTIGTVGAIGVKVHNAFNVLLDTPNILLNQTDSIGVQYYYRNADPGFFVMTNNKIRDGIVQRCRKLIAYDADIAGQALVVENTALLGDLDSKTVPTIGGSNVQYAFHITGELNHLVIRDCHLEEVYTSIWTDAANSHQITEENTQHHQVPAVYNLLNADDELVCKSSRYRGGVVPTTPYNVYDNVAGTIDNINQPSIFSTIYSSLIASGAGVVRHLYKRPVVTKTANYTIKTSDNQRTFDNTGAGAGFTWILPPADRELEYSFIVEVGIINFNIDPDGTDQIMRLTDAGGDRVRSVVEGDKITLTTKGDNKWYAGEFGTWLDVN